MTTYTVDIGSVPGTDDLAIPLPPEILEKLQIGVGDELSWEVDGQSILLSKKVPAPTEMVLVETLHTFRIRYVVEVPVGKKDWALDTVVCEEAKEFSQKFLDEVIIGHRVIDETELARLHAEDNPEWVRELASTLVTRLK